jgi:hypothetical protein
MFILQSVERDWRRSVDELERELNLPRRPGCFGNLAETRSVEDVSRQAHADDVEEIEELGPELEIHALGAAGAMAEGRALDEGEVVVVISWAAESVAAKVAEDPLIGTGATGNFDGDGKEIGGVVCAFAEVVFAIGARGGETRCGDLVGAIDAIGACAGLLDSGVDGEG